MCPWATAFFDWGGQYGLKEPQTVLSADWECVGWVLSRKKFFGFRSFPQAWILLQIDSVFKILRSLF